MNKIKILNNNFYITSSMWNLYILSMLSCIMVHMQQHNKLESSQSPHTSAKAMLFARWQHHLWFVSGFPYAPLKRNENFKVVQNPGFLPDYPQNWITFSFCHSRHSQKISERSVHNFLSYLANTQTDRQTKSGKNITSLVEVNIARTVTENQMHHEHQ